MTKFNELKIVDKKITQPNIPKTYEQFVLEEKNSEQKDLYPELNHEDISKQEGYGPCRDSVVPSSFALIGRAAVNVACPHSKEELFWQLKEAESELRSEKERFANELKDLKNAIENHHVWLGAIESIRENREEGMRASRAMNLIPPFGSVGSFVSSTFIDAVSRNDINQAKSSEREAKSSVLSKVNSLISRYGG